MTEADWLTTTDVQEMLYVVHGPEPEYGVFPARKISDRKLRLWCAALALSAGLHEAVDSYWHCSRWMDGEADQLDDAGAVDRVVYAFANAAGCDGFRAGLLRCVVGNPFREIVTELPEGLVRWPDGKLGSLEVVQQMRLAPVVVRRDWLAWNGGTVVQLAAAIYEGRRWDDMPVLADALCEAGCAEEHEIVRHLRGEEWLPDATVTTGHRCPKCGGQSPWRRGVGFEHERHCWNCHLSWEPGETLRLPGGWRRRDPLVWCRGDWSLDLILRKE